MGTTWKKGLRRDGDYTEKEHNYTEKRLHTGKKDYTHGEEKEHRRKGD